MARIRSIKPELFLNEQVGELSMAARVFFVGLFTQADREGRVEWAPKRLKVQLFPYDAVDLDALAAELVAHGLARIYRAGDGWCLDLPRFTVHQRPHPKEAASTLPACPDDWKSHGEPWNATASRETPGAIPSCPAGKGREGDLGREGKGAGAERARKGYGDPFNQRIDPNAAALIIPREGQTISVPGGWWDRARRERGLVEADVDAFAKWAGPVVAAEGLNDDGKRLAWLDAMLARWLQARKVEAEGRGMDARADAWIKHTRELRAKVLAERAAEQAS